MHSKEKERMPVSDVWEMSRNRPREQKLECFAAFGGSEGAKESPKTA